MKKLTTRQLLIVILIIDIVLCGSLLISGSSLLDASVERQISEFNIQRICELATLECFYHNVSQWNKSGNFIGYGAKKLWIEYDGIVRVGVKADQIRISEPDKDGLITVTIPEAVILDKDLDEKSMYEIDSSLPMWGFIPLYSTVNTEERKKAISEAQDDMVSSASKNGMILVEARERAKKIIEKNIKDMCEASGKNYKVKFSASSEVQTITSEEA